MTLAPIAPAFVQLMREPTLTWTFAQVPAHGNRGWLLQAVRSRDAGERQAGGQHSADGIGQH
jgi:hypothetical protein